jgi:hypothetical protein
LTSRTRRQNIDAYRILGVEPHATPSQIKTAYRTLIRAAHPDVNGGDEDMAVLLNEAYAILSDPQRRASYDRGTTTTRQVQEDLLACPECGERVPVHVANAHWRSHLIEKHGALCVSCSRYPTRPLRLKSHAGFLLWRTSAVLDENFCRSCGTGVFRQVQARNITRGPWGLISFFATTLALFGNAGRFTEFKNGLDSPTPPHPVTESVLEGRSVIRRPGVLIVLGIVLGASLLVLSNVSQPGNAAPTEPSYTPPPVTRSIGFATGACVSFEDGWVTELPTCSGAEGEVETVVSDPEMCPQWDWSYVERDDGTFACLLEY